MKPVIWLASSLEEIRRFPEGTRRDLGYQLFRIQSGLEPNDAKPMASIGSGVMEIRIHQGREFRVVYVAKYREAIYVLHAFEKKTRKTPGRDIALAQARFRVLVQERKAKS